MDKKEKQRLKDRDKEFKTLQKDNDKIRKNINKIMKDNLMSMEAEVLMSYINELVENEIQQEGLCGE